MSKLTVYARSYGSGDDVVDLVEHEDGRVGLWSPIKQQWISVFGNGTNQAGFVKAMLDGTMPIITTAGQEWLQRRKAHAL